MRRVQKYVRANSVAVLFACVWASFFLTAIALLFGVQDAPIWLMPLFCGFFGVLLGVILTWGWEPPPEMRKAERAYRAQSARYSLWKKAWISAENLAWVLSYVWSLVSRGRGVNSRGVDEEDEVCNAPAMPNLDWLTAHGPDVEWMIAHKSEYEQMLLYLTASDPPFRAYCMCLAE